MDSLIYPSKCIVKPSPGKGLGVFATELIREDEIIEECHLLTIPDNALLFVGELFVDYRFNWPKKGKTLEQVLPLGFGCIYNHSDNNNAIWKDHPTEKLFQFIAIQDILPGEEIYTYYGDSNYWNRRNHIKLS
jgi:SET domain-containing protein